MMSSPHGPHELGYTRVTMARTVRSNLVKESKSINLVVVRIVDCNPST